MTASVSEVLTVLGLKDDVTLSDPRLRALWLRGFLRSHGWLVGYSREGSLLYAAGDGCVCAVVRAVGLCAAELRSYLVEEALVPPVDDVFSSDVDLSLAHVSRLISRVFSEPAGVRRDEAIDWVEFRSRFLFKRGYARAKPSWQLLGVACHELIQWRAARR